MQAALGTNKNNICEECELVWKYLNDQQRGYHSSACSYVCFRVAELILEFVLKGHQGPRE